jgi:NitT/TauT family transport system ATP-binding protein
MTASALVERDRTLSPGITLHDVGYTYPGSSSPAIRGIDLSVAAGELVCLLGPSGCGKSTLLRLIAGLLRPRTGTIELDHSTDARGTIGWMAQRDGLLPWRTVLENVALPLELQHEPTAAARRILARIGLPDADSLYPHQLSGGMRQRVALARAVVHQPGLLLLDEPFAHLDELTRDEMGDELLALWAEQPLTIIMVTHSALEAVRLADRVVVLSHRPGQVVGEVQIEAERPRHEVDREVIAAVTRAKGLMRDA